MKAPHSPTRFQSSRRTHHHHQEGAPSWDDWVEIKKRNSSRFWKKAGILAGILAFSGIVAAVVYQIR